MTAPRLVNVSGTMTSLGASRMVPEAAEAMLAASRSFVDIGALQRQASTAIAAATGAEAGFVTASAAAGMVLALAGMITGPDLDAIERLPRFGGAKRRIAIQAGHLVNYGAPVEQAIWMAGGEPSIAGSAARCETYNLEAAIGPDTAAVLHVVSHHTVQEGGLALPEVVSVAATRGVPVIVDMASEMDLAGPSRLGADVAVWSAQKFLAGPTAGIVAGRKSAIRAAYLQNRGIGRHMKTSKEGIAGTIAALAAWSRRDHAGARAREERIIAGWQAGLAGLPGLVCRPLPDWTGNPITRLEVMVTAQARLHAWELADRLAALDPAVIVRDDLVEHGVVHLDPCNVTDAEAALVAPAIRGVVEAAHTAGDGLSTSHATRRRAAAAAALAWPD